MAAPFCTADTGSGSDIGSMIPQFSKTKENEDPFDIYTDNFFTHPPSVSIQKQEEEAFEKLREIKEL